MQLLAQQTIQKRIVYAYTIINASYTYLHLAIKNENNILVATIKRQLRIERHLPEKNKGTFDVSLSGS
jgi:hypothetical protein